MNEGWDRWGDPPPVRDRGDNNNRTTVRTVSLDDYPSVSDQPYHRGGGERLTYQPRSIEESVLNEADVSMNTFLFT